MSQRYNITVRKGFQGQYVLSTIDGYFIERQYFGYTLREAKTLFRQYLKESN